jgi:beta-galactosidase/beta-glucuronidase
MQRGIAIPRNEYPRPDFYRESYLNLNGTWEFLFDDDNVGVKEEWFKDKEFRSKIVVPYTYLCELSGINNQEIHEVMWYKKTFRFEDFTRKDKLILHFGAVDFYSDIWVNGIFMYHHEGGSIPFSVDITNFMNAEEITIVVRAEDNTFDLELPRGKQFWKQQSESIFYTRTSGIWQTVWIESIANDSLERVWITPDLDNKMVEMDFSLIGSKSKEVEVTISLDGKVLIADRVSIINNRAKRKFWLDDGITLTWNHQESWAWFPDNPILFDVNFRVINKEEQTVEDEVTTYFAFRKISVENGKLMLNNRPYFMKMVLDQGYWRKSLLTAPTDEDFVKDIKLCKEMGFNGARKHQKVEDPRYLFWADKLGFLVWGESDSAYIYSRKYAEKAVKIWIDIVKRDYNHPCIVAWVPLNESWGVQEIMINKEQQMHSLSLYYLVKSLDQTRLVISNDGWNHTKSDLLTIHDYESSYEVLEGRYESIDKILDSTPSNRTLIAQGYEYSGEPIIVSEFGGISFCKDNTVGWGYSNAQSDDDFSQRYHNVVAPLLKSSCVQGFVYTQLCDIEQEINGLLTYDREYKVNPEIISAINKGKWEGNER